MLQPGKVIHSRQNSVVERFPTCRTGRVGTPERVCRTERTEAARESRGLEEFCLGRVRESGMLGEHLSNVQESACAARDYKL